MRDVQADAGLRRHELLRLADPARPDHAARDARSRRCAKITGETIRVTASGRTDAGVHALGQVVSFRSETAPRGRRVCIKALNAELPRDMAVLAVAEAADGFSRHRRAPCASAIATCSTTGRFATSSRGATPGTVAHRLDADGHAPRGAGAGRHARFQQLRDAAAPQRESSVRTVFEISVERAAAERHGERLSLEIEADGFLYNMVRTIVGTLVEVGRGVASEAVAGRGPGRPRSQRRRPDGARRKACFWCASTIDRRHRASLPHADRSPHHATDPGRRAGKHAADVRGSAAHPRRRRAAGHRSAAGARGQPARRASSATACRCELLPALRRAIHPLRDPQSYLQIKRALARLSARRRPHAQRQGGAAGPRRPRTRSACRRSCTRCTARRFIRIRAGGRKPSCAGASAMPPARCDALVSVADAMTDLLVAARVAPREKFTTIYSGMEVEPFLARRRASRSQMRAAVGLRRRARRRRQDRAAVSSQGARVRGPRGASRSIAQQPNVRFLFVGDGILAGSDSRAGASAPAWTPYFQFTGLVPPEQIPGLIGAMDIVVHTSLREGLARVLPQALIAGKPVVSYDVDGAREVVITGETGFLLPPQSDRRLGRGNCVDWRPIRSCATDWAAEGRERFTDQFRHEHMTAQLRALYERILSAKAGAADSRRVCVFRRGAAIAAFQLARRSW